MPARELVNVSQAAKRLEIPRTTINNWIRDECLFRVGIDAQGVSLYDLAAVRKLAESTVRRPRRRTATRR